ncbi:hypothetical protein [Noviherbaspirillum massiliense]|uniref:hypothetical protein n=1 Tax=Noviherbaspirillum massiliense TaxID=1465823 RepID=UPI0002E109BA|nr:hypothetical protein [Noviherbaspirillum massiliense]
MISKNDLLGAPAKPLARARNILLDAYFYDIEALSRDELSELSTASDHEGAVIVVAPSKHDEGIRHYRNATEMLKRERDNIRGVAIAGVGSSIVGTAALARNVADTYGFDVAGIVSGYGAVDLMTEAMGGWFFYGYLDRLRHYLEILVEKSPGWFPSEALDDASSALRFGIDPRNKLLPRELDSGTLLDILRARPKNLELLVGHSKGALLIDFVLEQFVEQMDGRPDPYYDELHVVTVSAVVGVPRKFKRTVQIIGELDWFGAMNSLPDLLRSENPEIQPRYVDNACHHLNPGIPYPLALVEALSAYLPMR